MIIRVPPQITNKKTIDKYLTVDLWSWLKDLTVGLLKVSFKDNFQSFTVTNVSIPANTEISLYNQFLRAYPGQIPSGRIIIRQIGNALITDGVTPWTYSQVYLKNVSDNDATISVMFFL